MIAKNVSVRTVLIIGLLTLVLALLTATVVIWKWTGEFGRTVAELQEAGQPVSVADLINQQSQKKVGAEPNAAPILANSGDEMDSLVAELGALKQDGTRGVLSLSREQWEQVEELFNKHSAALGNAKTAANCTVLIPAMSPTIGSDAFLSQTMDLASQVRSAAIILWYRAVQLAEARQYERALDHVLQMIRLAELLGRQPLQISYLSSAAIKQMAASAGRRVLQRESATFADRQHDRLEAVLAAQETDEWYVESLRSERAFMIDRMQQAGVRSWIMQQRLGGPMLAAIEAEIARTSGAQSKLKQQAPLAGQQPPTALARQQQTTLEAARKACDRSRTALRRLRIVNALKQHGKDPTQWDAGQLESLPIPDKAKREARSGDLIFPK